MTIKVPDMEIIHSVLNKHFAQDVEPGGYAQEDENGVVYLYNADRSLYAYMPPEVWFELLDYSDDKEKEETK